MKHRIVSAVAAAAMLSVSAAPAAAQDAKELASKFDCSTVNFGLPNWTGVRVKTATATWMLDQLGYKTDSKTGSLPMVYQAMKGGDIDALLAQWMPSQRSIFRKYGIEGSLDVVSPNLLGGHYTLAVPTYVYEAGVKSIADLDEHKEKFGGQIFGIEAGSGGNDTIKSMLEDDYAGLGDWDLVASSEPGMLAEVEKRVEDEEWITFLAWAPHPMNINHDFKYLAGGEDYWGPNKGEVIVNTVTPEGYAWACPNIGQFLDNYDWTVEEQSLAMGLVNNDGMEPLAAGKRVLAKHPEMLERWFGRSGIYQTGGIKDVGGEKDALPIVRKALKQ
ncbi:glycine betaine/proline transport system substrate-binding protein [Limimonas halophila]|uniref:Glycine betaine/proline transport system substrate-binding protein n=1 Tax=Limimonas halophila TaxID=1082479 RepID=A0A1G7PZM9_9PROT|nr:ABC transporter substrate-binding protein [Limimonas halophila]SDF91714.1 glycine betaine/proline transport system substrate-binding protein [Limimonas halophila]